MRGCHKSQHSRADRHHVTIIYVHCITLVLSHYQPQAGRPASVADSFSLQKSTECQTNPLSLLQVLPTLPTLGQTDEIAALVQESSQLAQSEYPLAASSRQRYAGRNAASMRRGPAWFVANPPRAFG